jgi:hypothetical protein
MPDQKNQSTGRIKKLRLKNEAYIKKVLRDNGWYCYGVEKVHDNLYRALVFSDCYQVFEIWDDEILGWRDICYPLPKKVQSATKAHKFFYDTENENLQRILDHKLVKHFLAN